MSVTFVCGVLKSVFAIFSIADFTTYIHDGIPVSFRTEKNIFRSDKNNSKNFYIFKIFVCDHQLESYKE